MLKNGMTRVYLVGMQLILGFRGCAMQLEPYGQTGSVLNCWNGSLPSTQARFTTMHERSRFRVLGTSCSNVKRSRHDKQLDDLSCGYMEKVIPRLSCFSLIFLTSRLTNTVDVKLGLAKPFSPLQSSSRFAVNTTALQIQHWRISIFLSATHRSRTPG